MTKQWFSNGIVELGVLASMGPRITDFRFVGGESFLAETPDITLPAGGGDEFRMVGGHRLWAAPEIPAITYVPDDTPPVLEDLPSGLCLTQPAPAQPAIEKTMEISLEENDHRLSITHRLTNRGDTDLVIAAWAITMVRTHGTAIVPLGRRQRDPYQADRSIVLWPYTKVSDPLIGFYDTHVEMHARREEPAKIGTSLGRGWLAYLLDDIVFVKRAKHADQQTYADLGASGQVYCHRDFCELETLGPLTTLAPSTSVAHREVWELYERERLPESTSDVAAVLDEGGSP